MLIHHNFAPGPDRDFILAVRTEPMTSSRRDVMLRLAESELHAVENDLVARTWRYPEMGDARMLDDWLIRLRRSAHCL